MDEYDEYDDDEIEDIVGRALGTRMLRRVISRADPYSKKLRPRRRSPSPRAARSVSVRSRRAVPSYMKTRPRAGGGAEFPLGFSTIQFVNAGATSLIMTATPQRRGKPNRLTIIQARSAITVVGLVTITDLKVGTLSQLVSNDPIPAGMFAADAVGTELEIAEVGPGIEVALLITLSATPPVGETLDISAALICDVLD